MCSILTTFKFYFLQISIHFNLASTPLLQEMFTFKVLKTFCTGKIIDYPLSLSYLSLNMSIRQITFLFLIADIFLIFLWSHKPFSNCGLTSFLCNVSVLKRHSGLDDLTASPFLSLLYFLLSYYLLFSLYYFPILNISPGAYI